MLVNELPSLVANTIGAIAVTILFLYYLDRNEKRTSLLIQNHLHASTDALNKMSQSLSSLTECINGLKKLLIATMKKNK